MVVFTLVLDGMSVPVCRSASLQFHAELSELMVMIDTSERTAESGNKKDRIVGGTALLISSVFVYPRPEDVNGSPQQQCFSLMLIVVLSRVARLQGGDCRGSRRG